MNRDAQKGACGAGCDACAYGKQNACPGCFATHGSPAGVPCFIFRYLSVGDKTGYDAFVAGLLREINSLAIPGLPAIRELFPINGAYVNLAYPLPGGASAKFLDDRAVYLAAQVPCTFDDGTAGRFFGVVADPAFLLVGEYGPNGADPVLLCYHRR